MKIKIKTLSGVQHVVNVEKTDKVESLKKKVEEKVGIPPVQQRLVFQGKILPDNKLIGDVDGLKADMTVQLIVQLKGGF